MDIDGRIEELRSGDVTLGVIGLGYVGLPLAVEAARAGIRVLGFDVSEAVVERINEGESHVEDVPDDAVGALVREGVLEATSDMARLTECDAISICVPTPLSKTRDPDVSYIVQATESVAAELRPGQLVILESTTYPGTTRELLLPALSANGMEAGKDFFLCFSPERVDPGNEVWTTKNTPKVVGGITDACLRAATTLYERFLDTLVPVSSVEAAELSKILENTFRAINIGLANETALISDRLGVDVWEVIDAAATKPFGFMKFTPGPGLGGHCIPVDPQYLSWKMRTMNYRTRFIEVASEVNAEMPYFVAGKVQEALNRVKKPLNGSEVFVLGVAYKRDIGDVRESPAVDVIRILEDEGARIAYHDPHVPSLEAEGRSWSSVAFDPTRLARADAVLILTDHSDFDYVSIVENSRVLVDARNATARLGKAPGSAHPQRWIVKLEGADA